MRGRFSKSIADCCQFSEEHFPILFHSWRQKLANEYDSHIPMGSMAQYLRNEEIDFKKHTYEIES